jgi:hypothetical protein
MLVGVSPVSHGKGPIIPSTDPHVVDKAMAWLLL